MANQPQTTDHKPQTALVGIIMTVAIPYLINPDAADLGGKLGFFFVNLSAKYVTDVVVHIELGLIDVGVGSIYSRLVSILVKT
ncbi:MAG: hypothetical protein EOP50_08300 [Sphingobacteriales bacterium]|nr:MAG: hypothetical protein EOP50_08300 [Sphingobacteriales bacterium]